MTFYDFASFAAHETVLTSQCSSMCLEEMSSIVSCLRACICTSKTRYDGKWYLVIAFLVIGLFILILQFAIMYYLPLTREPPDGFEEVKPEGTFC